MKEKTQMVLSKVKNLFFNDWEKIMFLFQEIGNDLAFFLGLILKRFGDRFPFIKKIIANLQEGLCYAGS